MVHDLTEKFKDVSMSQHGFSFQNGAFIGMASAISAVQLYNFSKHFSHAPDVPPEQAMG